MPIFLSQWPQWSLKLILVARLRLKKGWSKPDSNFENASVCNGRPTLHIDRDAHYTTIQKQILLFTSSITSTSNVEMLSMIHTIIEFSRKKVSHLLFIPITACALSGQMFTLTATQSHLGCLPPELVEATLMYLIISKTGSS